MSKSRAATNIIVKLLVGAGQAAPTPPVGPALGSKGVKSIDFCREFNARTAHMEPGTPIPCRITIKPDRSFTFDVRTPPTSFLLLRAAGVEPLKGRYKGASRPGHETVGTVTMKHIYEIAKVKLMEERLQKMTMEGMCRTIVGHCKNMGVQVVN